MREYRIYKLALGRISGRGTVIKCGTDQEAIENGRQMLDGQDLEIWAGRRFVAKLNAADSENAAARL
jgi:hypothetical protein